MTPSPALMEAAKVLWEADAVYWHNGKVAPWEMLGRHTHDKYIRMAAALLKWERTREPSEAMIKWASEYARKTPDDTRTPEEVADDVHYALNAKRLIDLGVKG